MEQLVLQPPPDRQQYIAPLVKPVLCEQIDGTGQTWRICSVWKKMGTHLPKDFYTLEKNKEKKAEYIKKKKPQDLEKENMSQGGAKNIRSKDRMNQANER